VVIIPRPDLLDRPSADETRYLSHAQVTIESRAAVDDVIRDLIVYADDTKTRQSGEMNASTPDG